MTGGMTLDLYIPLRLDNGQPIIERVADLPQELITDLDRISVEMSSGTPLFGVSLAEAARLSDPDGLVPSVIRGGALWLIEHGLDTTGDPVCSNASSLRIIVQLS